MSQTQATENGKLFDDGECPICYSTPQVDIAIPPCGHAFCYQCIKDWSKKSTYGGTCPVCNRTFSEIAHNNGNEPISRTITQFFAEVKYCFEWPLFYMEGTPFLLLCWIAFLNTSLRFHGNIILGIVMILISFTGIVFSILQFRYVLIYGFLPRNLVYRLSIVNFIGFAVTFLCSLFLSDDSYIPWIHSGNSYGYWWFSYSMNGFCPRNNIQDWKCC